MSRKRKSIVDLNRTSEAFTLFMEMTISPVADARGETVEFEIGGYSHIVDDEDLLRRLRHIRETLTNPEEIRRSHHRGMDFREVYINTFFERDEDEVGESFLVVIDRRPTPVFWTCILPTQSYLRNVKRGRLLWSP